MNNGVKKIFPSFVEAKFKEPTTDSICQRDDFEELINFYIFDCKLVLFLFNKTVLYGKLKLIPR